MINVTEKLMNRVTEKKYEQGDRKNMNRVKVKLRVTEKIQGDSA